MAKDDPESRPIPVSELLARTRDAAAAAAADTGEIPRVAFPRSANPVVQRAVRPQPDPGPAAPAARVEPRTASGMPAYRQPAAAAGQEGEPSVEESNRVTGIIPAVEGATAQTAAVEASQEPQTGSFLRTDEDVDFESYRNFDDVIATEESSGERKRGLFGRRKRGKDAGGEAEPESTALFTDSVIEVTAETTNAIPAVPTGAIPSSSEETTSLVPVDAEDLYEDAIPVVDQPLVDPVTGRFVAPKAAEPRRSPEPAADDSAPAITPSRTKRTTAPPVYAAAATDDEEIVDVQAEQAEQSRDARRSRRVRAGRAEAETVDSGRLARKSTADVVDEAPLASKHSAGTQWVIVIGQMLAGLVLGAAAFWGFVQLWRWNVYFALVLSAIVIAGIVSLVHVVRRRHDLSTTLLALGVGLFITIGPLILLATS